MPADRVYGGLWVYDLIEGKMSRVTPEAKGSAAIYNHARNVMLVLGRTRTGTTIWAFRYDPKKPVPADPGAAP